MALLRRPSAKDYTQKPEAETSPKALCKMASGPKTIKYESLKPKGNPKGQTYTNIRES